MEPAIGRRLCRTALTLWVAPPGPPCGLGVGRTGLGEAVRPVRRGHCRSPDGRPRGQPPSRL